MVIIIIMLCTIIWIHQYPLQFIVIFLISFF